MAVFKVVEKASKPHGADADENTSDTNIHSWHPPNSCLHILIGRKYFDRGFHRPSAVVDTKNKCHLRWN